ncbi:hypothetical protein Y032_0009g427 [Ancylostoma ceylanicum]|nr:hypothetical protein Y032_0009g427 [Ancylostoma ceylanicum]
MFLDTAPDSVLFLISRITIPSPITSASWCKSEASFRSCCAVKRITMVKLLNMFRITSRRYDSYKHDFRDAKEVPRMAAGSDPIDGIPTCCGGINIRFLLVFLFTCLALLAAADLHRRGAFEYDRITIGICFAWSVFALSLIGALGTACESSAIMAILTVATFGVASFSLGCLVYITYVFYMVEENVEILKERKLLNPEVRKEDMNGITFVFVALPHALVMLGERSCPFFFCVLSNSSFRIVPVSLAISGLTGALIDYYKE